VNGFRFLEAAAVVGGLVDPLTWIGKTQPWSWN